MSYCKQVGKDRIIFVTNEELSKESKIKLTEPKEEDREPGLLLPNGEINWNCPCIGGMASGPCGFQFREAFSCFHNSQAENRGAECVEKFSILQECMASYPNLYPKRPDEEDDEDVGVVFEDDLHSDGTGRKESLQLGQDISLKEGSKKDS